MAGFILLSMVLVGWWLSVSAVAGRQLRETHLVVRFPPYSLARKRRRR